MSKEINSDLKFIAPVKTTDHFNLSLILMSLGFIVSCIFFM